MDVASLLANVVDPDVSACSCGAPALGVAQLDDDGEHNTERWDADEHGDDHDAAESHGFTVDLAVRRSILAASPVGRGQVMNVNKRVPATWGAGAPV